jgi:hypothetical protein
MWEAASGRRSSTHSDSGTAALGCDGLAIGGFLDTFREKTKDRLKAVDRGDEQVEKRTET